MPLYMCLPQGHALGWCGVSFNFSDELRELIVTDQDVYPFDVAFISFFFGKGDTPQKAQIKVGTQKKKNKTRKKKF